MTITYPKNAATRWVITVVATLVLVSACSGNGQDETPTTIPADESTTQAPAGDETTTETERTEVLPVDCRPLITLDEVDVALGVVGQLASMIEFSGSEACKEELASDGDFFVQIQPGDPSDFEPGATVLGVPGQPVTDVGDEAIWFAGEDAEGAGDIAALSVRQKTSVGVLHFRIVLGRPDLESAAQLEIVKNLALTSLPRFPGVEDGYVDNLLVKEQDGEWTRGEGLVATLGLFAGEAEAAQVLRHPQPITFSGTGVIRLAREYLEDGLEADLKVTIERLLGLLVVSRERLQAMVGDNPGVALGSPAAPSVTAQRAKAIAFTMAQGAGDCASYWGASDPCMVEAVSEKLDEEFGPGKYTLWVPDESTQNTEGWTNEHLFCALEAMEEAAATEEARGEMPDHVDLMFTPFDSPSALTFDAGDMCFISLNKPMQQLDCDEFKKVIASEMESCNLVIEQPDDSDECVLEDICDPSDYFSAAPR